MVAAVQRGTQPQEQQRPLWVRPPRPPLRVRRGSCEDEAVVFYFKDPQVVRTPRPRTHESRIQDENLRPHFGQ